MVTDTVPIDLARDVAPGNPLSATFDQPMALGTIADSFTLSQGTSDVPGVVTYAGLTATFTPDIALDFETTYIATISDKAENVDGLSLAVPYEWSFTTIAFPPLDAPFVIATIPDSDATLVELKPSVFAIFSEAMDAQTVTTASFVVMDGNLQVAGSVTQVGATGIFTPTVPFAPDTLYSATVTTAATDLEGIPLQADYVWSFTTGMDFEAPYVVYTDPGDLDVNVAVEAEVFAVFSEPMAAGTVSGATFLVMDGLTPVPGSVTYQGVSGVFTPTQWLDPNTEYTATVTQGAQDVLGTPLSQDYVWTFTTGPLAPMGDPTVVYTIPDAGDTSMDVNTAVFAMFSEPMNPLTVNSTSFLLADGVVPVVGAVVQVGSTGILTPAAPLSPDTLYTATITTAATDLDGLSLQADYVWSFMTGTNPLAPYVVYTDPDDLDTNVAIDGPLSAFFSEPMLGGTIDATTFLVMDGATPVPGAVSYAGVTGTFTPTVWLDINTVYTATVTQGAQDLLGTPLSVEHMWSFTTGGLPPLGDPTVIYTLPDTGDIDVDVDTTVLAMFSEPMDALTIDDTSFLLNDGILPVAGIVTQIGSAGIFSPATPLDADTLYTATITTAATDLGGVPLQSDYVWSFTTGMDLDAPYVVYTEPADLAVAVPIDAPVSAFFSELMLGVSIDDTTFLLMEGANPISGTVSYLGVTGTFTPDVWLDPMTVYTATITTGAVDVLGSPLIQDYVWSFTTGGLLPLGDPTVVYTIPDTGEVDVDVDSTVFAMFSEPMDPLTVDDTSFLLMDGIVPVLGVVTQVGSAGIFTPAAPLDPDTLYTATITTAATDLDGVSLQADYVWTFTTAVDLGAPFVVYTEPDDAAIGVPLDAPVLAFFSELMDDLTIDDTTFLLMEGVNPVAGVVSYLGVTGTFTPTVWLDPNTVYTATVTTGAQDVLGTPLVQDYVWSFTTGGLLPLGDPTVIYTIPDIGETGVALDSTVFAMFSEPMDPLTVDDTSFLLMDGIVPVLGVVTQVGSAGIFTPAAPLDPNTLYTATITTAATDMDGVSLQADYIWTFTTGADLGAPYVVYTEPDDLAIDVALEAPVQAFFSEQMLDLTIDDTTFLLMEGLNPIAGTVSYLGVTATFTPTLWLDANTVYTATITTGAQNLLGASLSQDYVWSFTTANVLPGEQPVDLGSLSTFVAVAGAGLTNSNSSGTTTLNGDVGLSPTATCMGDGNPCTLVNPVINGTLYANDPGGIAAQAKVDLTAALIDALGRPPGVVQADLAGLTLAPGIYTSTSTMTVAVGGTVVLDGQGNPNAVWIFQVGSSLTVNNDVQVLLINGAKAKNVFWAMGASSTLGSNVIFQGTILAQASNSVGTDSSVVGRLLCTDGQITLLSNTITLPPL